MSPQEPTPTPDDETPWKPLAIEELTEGQEIVVVRGGKERRFRVKSVNREGNNVTATMTSAEVEDAWYWPIAPAPDDPPEFDATALSKAAAEAVRRVTEHTIEISSPAADDETPAEVMRRSIADCTMTDPGRWSIAVDKLLADLALAGYELVNQVGTVQGDQWTDIPAHGLLRAGQQNNVAAVVLPEPDEHGCWYIDGTNDWLVHTGENGKRVFWETSVDLYESAPAHARSIAAALLAAAAKIEASE